MALDVVIKVARLAGTAPNWPLPEYQTVGAAGADLCAYLPQALLPLAPGARGTVPTGLAFEIPQGFEVQVRARSGLALRHGLMLVNAPGTIDSDYRGEVSVLLYNAGDAAFEITHGMRIAQIVVAPAPQARFVAVPALSGSARGGGGFGSTGEI